VKEYRVLFSYRAERQLADLYAYIADHSGRSRAENFTRAITADCMALSTFPQRGTKRDDIRANLRTKSFARRVTIAFSINEKPKKVIIHGIFYGGQNFEAHLHMQPKKLSLKE
jgi:toxin ParE1/3/4